MEGSFAKARQSAEQVVKGMTPLAKENPMAEWFLPTLGNVLVRFHRWDEILKLPEPDKGLHLAHAFWHFARGMAFSATAQPQKAMPERDALVAETKAIPAETPMGMNKAHQLLDIGLLVLQAKIARSGHGYKLATDMLAKAAQAEDTLNYDEPPDWYLPPRESLGAVLLEDKRPAEAEKIFREELKAHAKNPRALFGLAESLAAQDKKDEASKVRKDFEAGWKYADVKLQMADL
jgi:tetratricopeptide (TPR) repeat protein